MTKGERLCQINEELAKLDYLIDKARRQHRRRSHLYQRHSSLFYERFHLLGGLPAIVRSVFKDKYRR